MRKVTIKIPKLIGLLMLIVIISVYMYGWIKFYKKTELFNNQIKFGDSIEKVLGLMGKPTFYDILFIVEIDDEEIRAIRLVYEGKFYIGLKDLVLIFDRENARLIKKEKGYVF